MSRAIPFRHDAPGSQYLSDPLQISIETGLRADRTFAGIIVRDDKFRVETDPFQGIAGPSGHQDFDRMEEAISFFLEQFARTGGFEGLPGRLDQVIKDEGLAAAQAGIAFFDRIERSIRGLDEPLALALDDLTETFDAMAEQAIKFGADLAQVERLRQLEILAKVRMASEAQIDAFRAAAEEAEQLEFRFAFAVRDTLGAIVAALDTSANAIKPLPVLRLDLAVGEVSFCSGIGILSPTRRSVHFGCPKVRPRPVRANGFHMADSRSARSHAGDCRPSHSSRYATKLPLLAA